MKRRDVIHGQIVDVEVCPPSRRRRASRISKARYNRRPQKGAKYVAKENGQFKEEE